MIHHKHLLMSLLIVVWTKPRSYGIASPCIPSGVGDTATMDTLKIVSEDDNSTSNAHDPMPTKLVKQYIDELLPLITHIINCSLVSGTFPDEWKTALVFPLPKKHGLYLTLSNC